MTWWFRKRIITYSSSWTSDRHILFQNTQTRDYLKIQFFNFQVIKTTKSLLHNPFSNYQEIFYVASNKQAGTGRQSQPAGVA